VIRLAFILIILLITTAHAEQETYGEILCNNADYKCITTTRQDTWTTLFPESNQRYLIQRLNRMTIFIEAGMKIASPKKDKFFIQDITPFPKHKDNITEPTVLINKKLLAWGAFDSGGGLLWWGPISYGTKNCTDNTNGCETPNGSFHIINKGDVNCSNAKIDGGDIIPYCMFFTKELAIHGSYDIPGYPDSHGSIRIPIEDAVWLNKTFVSAPSGVFPGTQVIIED
jgi:L,D-transpeptidase catalytic domain